MRKLFYPETVAVIGASRNRKKVGNIIFRNLLNSKVKAIPVNPNANQIEGVKAYKSVLDYKESIDLAIIVVKPNIVPKVLEECGKKGIKYVIIITAGFSEVGNYDLEKKLLDIAKKYNIRILGPNCFGIINSKLNLNATFYEGKIYSGKVSFISQSGALISSILDRLEEEKIGLNFLISLGNQLDIKSYEILEFLEKEDNKATFLYLEGIKDGKKLLETVRKLKKPVIIIKGGKTEKGLKLSQTHTASVSSSYDIIKGVLEVANEKLKFIENFKTMFNLMKLFNFYDSLGNRGLVISNAGGLAVLLSDSLTINNFQLPILPKEFIEKLNDYLPPYWNKKNPIDVIGDANEERYLNVLKIAKDYDFYDFIIVALTPQATINPINLAKELIKMKEVFRKPILTFFLGGEKVKKAIKVLEDNGIFNISDLSDINDLALFRDLTKNGGTTIR